MAVYKVEKGEWTKVASDLTEVIDWRDEQDAGEALGAYGFSQWDDVEDVYQVYRCTQVAESGPLAGVRHVFMIESEGDLVEEVLVSDWFPDYLHVAERLEVLVRRHKELLVILEQQRRTGRFK